ncbi:MAG: Asp-tRNA(Asn)/Glu-tRNA(Gln) amidotransferase subunit GatA [Balneolaceae bacterium]|nr:Asp-tRNA(Asn)/Glu-tRNA(Gln) amidotransferase subunit GatA [Balneolaceae bacterium]
MIPSFLSDRHALMTGKATLPELVSRCLASVDSTNQEVNALVEVYPEEALSQAAQIQSKIQQGKAGPLAGAIFSIKDLFAHKDRRLQSASKILDSFTSLYDATVVERILEADGIILGRANQDEFGMGSSNEYSIYGPCKHPDDLQRVPGGSSGGSAASVAAGYCNLSLGSDTGGSVRQPAAFCGVVGLKPSYGRVSRYGLAAYASSLDTVGCFGATVADVAACLEVIAGADDRDMTTQSSAVPTYTNHLEKPTTKLLRFGVDPSWFEEGLDPEIKHRIESLLETLKDHGHEVHELSMPAQNVSLSTYYILATAEASSNLARYDGIHAGYRAEQNEQSSLEEIYTTSRSEGFGPEVRRRILLGTYVLSKGYYDAYYAKAQKVRRLIQQEYEEAFQQVDVVLLPTTPTTAFKSGEKVDDPLAMYLNDVYTLAANLSGLSAMSVPIGRHSNGLPIGLQLQTAVADELGCFKAGKVVESLLEQVQ